MMFLLYTICNFSRVTCAVEIVVYCCVVLTRGIMECYLWGIRSWFPSQSRTSEFKAVTIGNPVS